MHHAFKNFLVIAKKRQTFFRSQLREIVLIILIPLVEYTLHCFPFIFKSNDQYAFVSFQQQRYFRVFCAIARPGLSGLAKNLHPPWRIVFFAKALLLPDTDLLCSRNET